MVCNGRGEKTKANVEALVGKKKETKQKNYSVMHMHLLGYLHLEGHVEFVSFLLLL